MEQKGKGPRDPQVICSLGPTLNVKWSVCSCHVMPSTLALPPVVSGWGKCPSSPGTASLADKQGLRGPHEDKVRATYQKPPRDRLGEWPLLLPPSCSPLQSSSRKDLSCYLLCQEPEGFPTHTRGKKKEKKLGWGRMRQWMQLPSSQLPSPC